jgi:ectoine hydroxylase-related dioxygenase (phytanoyl-CoA dioxygenase family)
MRELETSNHLLGNREALDASFEKNGYWAFKNVLDMDAIRSLRQKYIEVLEKDGLVRPGDEALEYTGKPKTYLGEFWLEDRNEYKSFVNNPKIKGFIEEVVGEEIAWVPIFQYRAVTPLGSIPADRRQFWHTDGHYNPGIPFISIWIPLNDMDEENGGLAVRPGLHNGPSLYPKDVKNPTSREFIPFMPHDHELLDDSVATYPFKLGDVVIFHRDTPHSGLHNLSNRFRLSFDVRFVRASDNIPLVGTLMSVEKDLIKVKSLDDGHVEALRISADTYFREVLARHPVDCFEKVFPIGTEVIVARENGFATTVTHVWVPEKEWDDRGPLKETYA